MAYQDYLSMAVGGYYNEHCVMQKCIIEQGIPLLRKVLKDTHVPHVTIVDYGCSEGSNYLHLLEHVLDVLNP
jgi:hypothetical protein